MKMNRYPAWFPNTLLCIFGLLVGSGVLLIPSALLFRLEWDVPWALPGDSRVGVAAIHVGAAMLVLVAIGALLPVHVRNEWNKRRNRRSGIGIIALVGLLALTGLGNLYAGAPLLSKTTCMTHIFLGLAVSIVACLHIFLRPRQ